MNPARTSELDQAAISAIAKLMTGTRQQRLMLTEDTRSPLVQQADTNNTRQSLTAIKAGTRRMRLGMAR